jgi:uncharacterized protein (DUF427 family)
MSEIPEELRAVVEQRRNYPRQRPAQIETPGPGQESVWDYPRPPRVEPARRRVRVELGGVTLAESDRALRVVETGSPPAYYVPAEDVRMRYLEPSEHTTLCEWKGLARYWTAHVGERVGGNAAWSYPDPWPGYEQLRNYVAFYPSRADACFLDDEPVEPQPGSFYGGWITSDLSGPFKGEPGSEEW